jgi:ribose transport system ATP-binding protein
MSGRASALVFPIGRRHSHPMAATGTEPLRLDMRGITKMFPGTVACEQIDFDLRHGEIHALVGQNGAGKSTLIKVLAGIHSRDAGEILVEGTSVEHLTPRVAHDLGMRFIHQELNLVPQFNVAENIVLGDPYPIRRPSRLISWPRLNRHVGEILDDLGISIDPRRSVQSLSVAEQWMVAIARALYSHGRILVMDEPTSSLAREDVQELFELVRSLAAKGTSVIYISHRLEEIFELCSRVTILKDGRKVATTDVAMLDLSELVRLMVGGRPQELYPTVEEGRPLGEVALEVEGLTSADGRLTDLSFRIRSREVLGVTGLLGAGHNELADLLFGVGGTPALGRILLDGRTYQPRSARRAIGRGIGLVPAERRSQGVVGEMRLWENIILAHLQRFLIDPVTRVVHRRRARKAATEQVRALQIVATNLEQEVQYLSGGNQQKVVLAKWLLRQPRLLVLSEPTRGIDVSAKAEIYGLVRRLADGGGAILFVSTEAEELAGVCDRVLVLRRGRLIANLPRQELSARRIMEACYGG